MNDEQLEQVLEDEERLRELKAQNRQKVEPPEPSDNEEEVSRKIQKGTIRDYERNQTAETYTFKIETAQGKMIDAVLPMATEYTLDEELVTLLEWKGISDGKVGDLLGEQVCVNAERGEFVLPETMSPVSKGLVHLMPITHYLTSKFDGGLYLILAVASLLTLMPATFLAGLTGPIILLFGLLWTFVLGPMVKFPAVLISRKFYDIASEKWAERYHEL